MSHQVSERGSGGAAFAGVLLILGGGMWMLQGLAGVIQGTSYLNAADYWITTSAASWGWMHLLGGAIGFLAGFGVLNGRAWARLLGIAIATISIFVNFAFIPLAPWWAVLIILVDLWIIHSLIVHRRLA